MAIPKEYSFSRYLAAKVSVDDRALNRRVWDRLADCLMVSAASKPLRVLEVGAGIGSMAERLLDMGMLRRAHYTAIDLDPENIVVARQRLITWAQKAGFDARPTSDGLYLRSGEIEVQVELEAIDAYDFLRREAGQSRWDLLLAHAFLDLEYPCHLTQAYGSAPSWRAFLLHDQFRWADCLRTEH
jgi:hypothetical protein